MKAIVTVSIDVEIEVDDNYMKENLEGFRSYISEMNHEELLQHIAYCKEMKDYGYNYEIDWEHEPSDEYKQWEEDNGI